MTTMNRLRSIIEDFGFNATLGIKKGLSVQDVCDLNKLIAISKFGLTEKAAEKIVEIWVKECKDNNIMVGLNK